MENTATQRNQFVLTYGAIMGIAQVFLLLILYLTDNLVGSSFGAFKWVIFFIILFIGLKSYRDKFGDGFITYGRTLAIGIRMSMLSGVFIGAYYFLMLKIFDPGLAGKIIAETEEAYLAIGFDEGTVEKMSEALQEGVKPWTMFFSNIFDGLLSGLFVSLIVGLFVKRKGNDPFQEAMKHVQ
ncbi:DUF4199 domain-containing protein [Geofilum sp. OHC36d9]|uniref:DUF4199 domain-containing protein n=1 Tax=Geofilum sp. OHC36d9 TaxID=3458413 RepID=UPI00403392D6